MKNLKKIAALALVGLIALACAGCGGNSKDAPIKIGFVGCISGADAYLGQTAVLALEDKVAEINEAGGILGRKVELVSYDIGLDPTPETINAANRLVEQDGVVAIIGPESSDQAIAAVDIMQDAKVPMLVTTASNETVTVSEDGKLNDYMFRMCFIDAYQGEALAMYTYNKLGITKVAVLGDIANLYTQGIQEFFIEKYEALGGTITSVEGFVDTDTEFRAALTNIKNSDAEAILIATGTYKIAGYIGQQCRELGIGLQILGVDGWYADDLIPFAGDVLDGSVMCSMMDETAPEYTAYREAFSAKHGTNPNYFAYYAVDALMCIQWAIEKSGEATGEAISKALGGAQDIPVFTGTLTIDAATHNPVDKSIYILEVTADGFKTIEKYDPKS